MIKISADINGNILVINYDNTMSNYVCAITALPDDFYKYLSIGKYLANAQGLYTRNGWVDFMPSNINWTEPTWKYRINVNPDHIAFFADNYPEMLVALNQEPKNPKIRLADGTSLIYVNSIGMDEKLLYENLGIIVEEYVN